VSIKETLKEIFESKIDGVSFIPADSSLSVNIKGFSYAKKSKYEKYDIGYVYHILIYKCEYDGTITTLDNFEAVLTDPYVYVSNLIECDFYGVVSKKTKKSNSFIKEVYAQVKKFYVQEYEKT